ncbi:MAG: asparagine synthase-related protein, partial [Methanosarcinaceae archaeon]|nr:asparagine synthase-related protein [Methanosarcinaceae archaeon]
LLQAEFAARELGMEQKLVFHVLSPEEIEAVIPELIWTLETVDPLKIAIGLPLYIVAKEARKAGVRVLLTGQGSDELLAGYRRHEVFFEAGEDVLDREIFGDLCKISELNLERDDMVTMANGVELRVPFLDPEVIRVGLAISPELKVQKRNGAYIRKYILRKVARDLLSPELALKEKKAMQYGTGVQKVLDKLAREEGFSRKKGKHIEKYLGWVAEKKGFSF